MQGVLAADRHDDYLRAPDLDAAIAMLATGPCRILAGGTDVFPSLQDRPLKGRVLDISGVADLRQITQNDDHWSIGAAVSWREVIRAALPPAFDGLKAAACEVGSWQIQNRATLVGNICNASPAADGVPALLTMDAAVQLQSCRGSRVISLASFITGNRKTNRADDEMVTAILVPKAAAAGQGYFYKLGARRYLVISIGMVAMRLLCDSQQKIAKIAIAVGACSEVATRLSDLEQHLSGQPLVGAAGTMSPSHFAGLSPIDDVRAPASYRIDAVEEAVRRLIAKAGSDMGQAK